MPLLPYRTLQTTSTTGTGSLTLNAVASGRLSYQAAYGSSSIVVRYVISGATYFEIGIGTYDGGTPGTLTRTTVMASSNSGSLVSLPAGTADAPRGIVIVRRAQRRPPPPRIPPRMPPMPPRIAPMRIMPPR